MSDPLDYFKTLDEDQLEDELDKLVEEFSPEDLYRSDIHAIMESGKAIFRLHDVVDEDEFDKRYNQRLLEVASLNHVFISKDLFNDEHELSDEYIRKFSIIQEILYYWKHNLSSMIKLKKRLDPKFHGEINTQIGLSRFKNIAEKDDRTKYQQFVDYLYFTLRELGYRRQGKQCMGRIYTKEGYESRAWESKIEIEKFVPKYSDRYKYPDQYYNRTHSAGNTANAIKELETMYNPIDFPDIDKDRRLFSFENGVYETAVLQEDGTYIDCWYKHVREHPNDKITADLPTERSSCNYIPHNMPYEDHIHTEWYLIPTPNLQKIMDYQEFPEEVCRWMYILFGRLLYKVGELDGWQVLPFLKGKAGTGKSTALNYVCKLFYDPLDVGVLANNCDTKYALSGFVDKFLFIGPEIKGNLGLEQAEFQTIISGEATGINKKYKDPSSVEWDVPGIIAGNQPPNYQDNQGSISRRLVIFEFIKKVVHGDPQLHKKLQKELPSIMLKCNKAYLEARNKYGTKLLSDNILPDYFKRTRNLMAEETNPFYSFLNSDEVIYGEDLYIPKKMLIEAFKEFCKSLNIRCPEMKDTFVKGPLDDMDIKIESKKVCTMNNRWKRVSCCVGIDLKDNQTYEEEDDLEE